MIKFDKKSFYFLLSIVLISLIFSSCSSKKSGLIWQPALMNLEKGLTIDETMERIDNTPWDDFLFDFGDKKIHCLIYNTDFDQYWVVKTKATGGGYTQSKSIAMLNRPQMLVFVDGKLNNILWLADINKHEDDFIRILAPTLVEKYKEHEGFD